MRFIISTVFSILCFTLYAGELPESRPHAFHAQPEYEKSDHSNGQYKVLVNLAYTVGYSEVLKDPLWSAYHIKWTDTPHKAKRPTKFATDERTDSKITHDHYTSSGYDRGHMTPNHAIVSRYGKDAQTETFLMSNICPQKGTMNQQTWRYFEHIIATDFSEVYEDVWVIVGPIFDKKPKRLAEKSGNENAAIPKSFFAVVTGKNPNEEPQFLAIIMNQSEKGNQPLRKFVTTIDEIEKRTGLDLFRGMSNEVAIESEKTQDETWELEQILKP